LAIAGLLESIENVFALPGMFERVLELGAGWRDEPTYGPSREEFLAAL
jgi:hypothetical protein